LIRLAEGRPAWVVGFLDETWFSRLARPALNSWSDAGEPLRLIEQSVAKDDPDPKAISSYGLYVPEFDEVWLRFVDGRPVRGITARFLSWCCQKLQAAGKMAWVLIWDNASWHISKEVKGWITSHNREVKKLWRRSEDHKLPFAQEEPVAQLYGAQVGLWQAQSGRAPRAAHSL
jgi:hypothetical protein